MSWELILGLRPGDLIRKYKLYEQKEEGWLERQYNSHNAAVQRHVPNNQLLVFNVKEGWDPLCRFLGKDVPIAEDNDGSGSKLIPFPNVNESQDLKRATTMMKVVSYGWIPTVVIGMGYTIRLVLRGRRPAAT